MRRASGRSKASPRIDLNVLSRRISVITVALRQIIAGPAGGLRAGDRANRSAGDRAGDRSARPSGDKTAKQPSDDGAANGTCGRVRWRWRRRWRRRIRWRVSHWRRRWITGLNRRPIRAAGVVHDLDVGHIGRRTFYRLRVEIPGAPVIPPPAVASIVDFVAPAS